MRSSIALGVTVLKLVPVSIAFGAIFTVLTFWACNPGQPWWRKRELVTDLCYWFVIPLVARYLRIGLLVIDAALLFGIITADGLAEFYDDGHGPLASLPLWLQAAVFLVGSDLMMYGLHRAFHRPTMWKYHAIHHSSKDLDWISAARFHPVNIMLGSVATDVIPAARRHLAERAGVPGTVHGCAFGVRAREPQLDSGTVPLRDRWSGLSSLASHRGGAGR